MIKCIDIQKFGSFNNYTWPTPTKGKMEFRKLNIIYGRNYSGKTTISRIFACLEKQELHQDYKDAEFSIRFHEDSKVISQSDLLHDGDPNVFVYNSDYVKNNLSYLYREDGNINPFTLSIGKENNMLKQNIVELNEKLGTESDLKTWIGAENKYKNDLKVIKEQIDTKKESLEQKLAQKANNDIKTNACLFVMDAQNRQYNISHLRREIERIQSKESQFILDNNTKNELKRLLEYPAPKDDIQEIVIRKPNFNLRHRASVSLIQKKIRPTNVIKELINNVSLQNWVQNGITIHKDKRKACGFCGTVLPESLWKKLDDHFNLEYENMIREIDEEISNCEKFKTAINDYLKINKTLFYENLHNELDRIDNEWIDKKNKYISNLEVLIDVLSRKKESPFSDHTIQTVIQDNSDDIHDIFQKYNSLIKKHNSKSESLASDLKGARESLRFDVIANFIEDIDYSKQQIEIGSLNKKLDRKTMHVKKLTRCISSIRKTIIELENKLKDEQVAVDLINSYLKHYFGHTELILEAVGNKPYINFVIKRDNRAAKNLSEGEISLISFCYFIATLKDKLTSDAIIFIDDPISSLDNNHIYFVFSLIESVIAKKKDTYKQLFISTHNLEFLKYLKQLTYSEYRKNVELNSKKKSPDRGYFLIEKSIKNDSILKNMPSYLIEYATELHYLFEKIYNLSNNDGINIPDTELYNLGNNIRKFLEIYLFFKYPNHKIGLSERITSFFGEDDLSRNVVNRVINEHSHIENYPDKVLTPFDPKTLKEVAEKIINKMKGNDKDQYESFCKSIGATVE